MQVIQDKKDAIAFAMIQGGNGKILVVCRANGKEPSFCPSGDDCPFCLRVTISESLTAEMVMEMCVVGRS